LTKERDEARQALAQMASAVGIATDAAAAHGNGTMEVDSDFADRIANKKAELHKSRKGRTMPPEWATVDDLLKLEASQKATKLASGVHGMALDPTQEFVVLGGSKNEGTVYSLSEQKVVAKFKADAVISNVEWTGPTSFVSVLKNGAVEGFSFVDGKVAEAFTVQVHENAVIRAVAHPTGDLLVTVASDSWALIDLKAGQQPKVLLAAPGGETVFSTVDVHPDGELVAVGTTDGRILVYKLPGAELVSTLQGQSESRVASLAFSENGYWLSSATDKSVTIWDLRKLVAAKALSFDEVLKGDISAMQFDYGGRYLAVGSSSGGLVVAAYIKAEKQWKPDVYSVNAPVVGLAWGSHAKSISTVNGSGTLSVYSTS
jgi:pre-mRNA-processing factor 19